MHETVEPTVIVGVYAALIGIGWGALVDPLRPASWWIAVLSVVLTGLLIAGLAPDAAPWVPLIGLSFSSTAWGRDRLWRRSLIRQQHPVRTPPPPPPSASATG